MRRFAFVAMLALTGVITGHTSAPANEWAINATAIEACSCPHFCICYFNSHPAAHHDHGQPEHYCKFNNAYKVNQGHHGAVSLEGAKFWITGDLGSDFSQGQMDWALVTFDKATTPEQRKALGEILGYVSPLSGNHFRLPKATLTLGRLTRTRRMPP